MRGVRHGMMDNLIRNFIDFLIVWVLVLDLSASFVVEVDHTYAKQRLIDFVVPLIILLNRTFEKQSFFLQLVVKGRDIRVGLARK